MLFPLGVFLYFEWQNAVFYMHRMCFEFKCIYSPTSWMLAALRQSYLKNRLLKFWESYGSWKAWVTRNVSRGDNKINGIWHCLPSLWKVLHVKQLQLLMPSLLVLNMKILSCVFYLHNIGTSKWQECGWLGKKCTFETTVSFGARWTEEYQHHNLQTFMLCKP